MALPRYFAARRPTPERAESVWTTVDQARRYLHHRAGRTQGQAHFTATRLRVLGCRAAAVQDAARWVSDAHPAPPPEALLGALGHLWAMPVHEDRLLAIGLAAHYHAYFAASDVDTLFLGWLRDCDNAAAADRLARQVVGPIGRQDPATWGELKTWTGDRHVWVRRASILAFLPVLRDQPPPLEALQRTLVALAEDPEPSIRRATAWVLREWARVDGRGARVWMADHGGRLPAALRRPADRVLTAGWGD
jgi:3-methyladenine DNA glycosylase AlkD